MSYDAEKASFLVGFYYLDQESKTQDIRTLPAGAQAIADANFAAEQASEDAICALNPICLFSFPFGTSEIVVPRDINNLDITNTAVFGMMSFATGDNTNITIEGR